MKLKTIMLLPVFIISGIVSAAPVNADWDFTAGIHSKDGKYSGSVLGTTRQDHAGLTIGRIAEKLGQGLQLAEKYPELTSNAFKMTFVFTLRDIPNEQQFNFLWDSKADYYKNSNVPRDNSGLTLGFYNRGPAGTEYRPQAWLGFGTHTRTVFGKYTKLAPGVRHTLEFSYDGVQNVEFVLDGTLNSRVRVTPGGSLGVPFFKPVIGDRCVGNFFPFNGTIHALKIEGNKEVSLADVVQIQAIRRKAFLRGEEKAALTMKLQTALSLKHLTIKSSEKYELGSLSAGKEIIFSMPVETRLIPGRYEIKGTLDGETENGIQFSLPLKFSYQIAPIRQDKFRTMMWGYDDSFHIFQKTGFNTALQALVTPLFMQPAKKNIFIPKTYEIMDDMLCHGFSWWDYFCSGHWPVLARRSPALGKDGKVYLDRRGLPVLDPSDPKGARKLLELATLVADTYAGHPALDMLDLHSEIHDKSIPLFGERQREAYRKFSCGKEIPAEINGKVCPRESLDKFPFDNVIQDDHPILQYYRWYWTAGDSWRDLNSQIAEVYRKRMSPHFRSYFAPTTRSVPIQGGNIADIKGQWTYAYPDPIRLATAVDELAAFTTDVPQQPIIGGIQLICYRSQIAPRGHHIGEEPAWSKKKTNAAYITIPPDILQGALWSAISRRVEGIVFHGDGSLYAPPVKGAAIYTFTNGESEPLLKRMFHDIVLPLGSILKNVPDRERDIAILQSFPSAIFAQRGSYGWGGWIWDLHQALQWGGMDPKIIVDEELVRNKLAGIKVLILPHCDVMTETTVRIINEFQQRGGIVVTDGTQVPAILPDFEIKPIERTTTDGSVMKARLQKLGMELRKKIEPFATPYCTGSNPEIITHVRSWKKADYLFIINDKRTFGDYVGAWHRTMEKGLPNSGTVTIRRDAAAMYDLVTHKPIPFKKKNGKSEINVDFQTNDGRLYLVLPQRIAKWELTVPEQAAPGENWSIRYVVSDASGKPVEALLPIHVLISDVEGNVTDESGYAAAKDGIYAKTMALPLNIKPGKMRICITDFATGTTIEKTMEIIKK